MAYNHISYELKDLAENVFLFNIHDKYMNMIFDMRYFLLFAGL